jgi:hypothetical protein
MEVTVAGDGASDEIVLGEGDHVGCIEGTTWDGASATLQETLGDSFVDSDDPYNTGNALTRTANGKLFRLTGGTRYRLNVSSFGSTVGLRLIINRAGS